MLCTVHIKINSRPCISNVIQYCWLVFIGHSFAHLHCSLCVDCRLRRTNVYWMFYYQHHATNDIDLLFSILLSHVSSLALLKAHTSVDQSLHQCCRKPQTYLQVTGDRCETDVGDASQSADHQHQHQVTATSTGRLPLFILPLSSSLISHRFPASRQFLISTCNAGWFRNHMTIRHNRLNLLSVLPTYSGSVHIYSSNAQ